MRNGWFKKKNRHSKKKEKKEEICIVSSGSFQLLICRGMGTHKQINIIIYFTCFVNGCLFVIIYFFHLFSRGLYMFVICRPIFSGDINLPKLKVIKIFIGTIWCRWIFLAVVGKSLIGLSLWRYAYATASKEEVLVPFVDRGNKYSFQKRTV